MGQPERALRLLTNGNTPRRHSKIPLRAFSTLRGHSRDRARSSALTMARLAVNRIEGLDEPAPATVCERPILFFEIGDRAIESEG